MKQFEKTLIDTSFEDNTIRNLDLQNLFNKVKSFYNARKSKLFERDFYIYKQRILNNRTYTSISKDVNRSIDCTRTRFLIMSYYIDKSKEILTR
jgi:hypothetical protein